VRGERLAGTSETQSRVVQSVYRLQCPRWGNPPALQYKKKKENGHFKPNHPEVEKFLKMRYDANRNTEWWVRHIYIAHQNVKLILDQWHTEWVFGKEG
jgi:hypothetical protein